MRGRQGSCEKRVAKRWRLLPASLQSMSVQRQSVYVIWVQSASGKQKWPRALALTVLKWRRKESKFPRKLRYLAGSLYFKTFDSFPFKMVTYLWKKSTRETTLGRIFVQFVFCWTAAAPTASSMDKWSTFAHRIPEQLQSSSEASAQFFYVLPTPGIELSNNSHLFYKKANFEYYGWNSGWQMDVW